MSKLTYANMRKGFLSHVGLTPLTHHIEQIAKQDDFYNLCKEDMLRHNGSYLTIVNDYHTIHMAYIYKSSGYSDNGNYYIAYITPEERYDVPISKSALQEVVVLCD